MIITRAQLSQPHTDRAARARVPRDDDARRAGRRRAQLRAAYAPAVVRVAVRPQPPTIRYTPGGGSGGTWETAVAMAGIDTRTTGATDRNEGGRHLHAQVDRSVEPLPMGRPLIHQAALHGEVGGLVDHDAIPTSSRAVGAEFSGRGPLVWTYVRCLSR